jgi:hypothetical protein
VIEQRELATGSEEAQRCGRDAGGGALASRPLRVVNGARFDLRALLPIFPNHRDRCLHLAGSAAIAEVRGSAIRLRGFGGRGTTFLRLDRDIQSRLPALVHHDHVRAACATSPKREGSGSHGDLDDGGVHRPRRRGSMQRHGSRRRKRKHDRLRWSRPRADRDEKHHERGKPSHCTVT